MQPEGYDFQKLKRAGIVLIVLLVVFLGGRWIVNFLASGTLTVTTSNTADTISVAPAPTPLSMGDIIEQGKGSLSIRVHSGNYVVSVQGGTVAVNQTVHVGWLSSKKVSISPPKLASTEPVLYEGVQNVVVSSNRLSYLNPSSSGLEYINNQNEKLSIAKNQTFTSVAWADPEYGVAQNTSGRLYVIDGTTTHPLQSSISNTNNTSGIAYAIAPNRTIYIGLGSYLYRGTERDGFKQIYGGFLAGDVLVAANDEVMILNSGQHAGQNSTATVVATTGRVITKNFGAIISGWTSWSQNGKYIVVSVGQEPKLFDSSLNQVGIVPQPTLTSAGDASHTSVITDGAWLGDNVLFYHYGSQLWSYNISQQTTEILATMPNDELIQSISVSTDGSYVYTVTSGSDSLSPIAVHRVGLRNQSVPDWASQLQGALPFTAPEYSLDLRNFSGTPTIVINVTLGSNADDALQSAKSTVQGIIGSAAVNYDLEQGGE